MKKVIIIMGVVIVALIATIVYQNNVCINYDANNKVVANIKNVGQSLVTSKLKSLDLSNQNLKSIPSNTFDQINLEDLNISNNLITGSIQSQIGKLTKLKVISATNNRMTGVPAELGQLQDLEVLDLSNNSLTGLPNELGNLKNLKVFNISGNQYSQQDLDYIINKLPKTVKIITNNNK